MDEPEEHVYHTINREKAAMNKKRENPGLGLKKDMLKRLFRQERKREEDIEPNNSSNEIMRETDPSKTSHEK